MNKFIPLSSLKDTTGIVEFFRIRKPNGELDIEKEYLRRKAIIMFAKKTFWNKTQKQAVLFQKPNDFLK